MTHADRPRASAHLPPMPTRRAGDRRGSVASPRRRPLGAAVHPDLAAEQRYLDRAHEHLAAMRARVERAGRRPGGRRPLRRRRRHRSPPARGLPGGHRRRRAARSASAASTPTSGEHVVRRPPPRGGRPRRSGRGRLAGRRGHALLPGHLPRPARPPRPAPLRARGPRAGRPVRRGLRRPGLGPPRHRRGRPPAGRAGPGPHRRDARHRRHDPGRAGRGDPGPARPAARSSRAARAPARRRSASTAPRSCCTTTARCSSATACSSSGPNRLFLRYIAAGAAVARRDVGRADDAGRPGRGRGAAGDDADAVAALKGDAAHGRGHRAGGLGAGHAGHRAGRGDDPLRCACGWRPTRSTSCSTTAWPSAAPARRSVGSARERFRVEVVKRAQRRAARPPAPKASRSTTTSTTRCAGSAELRRAIDRVWPATTGRRAGAPPAHERDVPGRASPTGILTPAEQRAAPAQERAARAPRSRGRWPTCALVDEAEAVLGGRPRRYGHVVVDEAQDLSPMAWRMIARRCSRFPSMTVLGDLAQATAPGARSAAGTMSSRPSARPTAVHLAELEIGYRVPGQILDVANRLLPATGARGAAVPLGALDAEPLRGRGRQRTTATGRRRRRQAVAGAAAELVAAASLGRRHRGHAPTLAGALDRFVRTARRRARCWPPTTPRASSSTASSWSSRPTSWLAAARGARLLYIAMTRAVQELVIVHRRAAPP